MTIPADVSDMDRAVLAGGLDPDEVEQLQLRRQACHADKSAADAVREHAVKYRPERWTDFQELLPITAQLGRITRGDARSVAAAGHESGQWLPLLVASFIWGQGLNGYGPARLGRILKGRRSAKTRPTERIEESLSVAVEVLRREGTRRAYTSLRHECPIPHLGPAFFTKFLYFAGLETPDVRGPQPLILDRRLAHQMRSFWRRRHDPAAAWRWSAGGWSAYRYEVYLAFLNTAAEQLSAEGQPWTPDLVELLLFAPYPASLQVDQDASANHNK